MRHIALFYILAVCAVVSGCLSVIRLPCDEPGKTKYSDEGVCTNRVWTTFISDIRKKNPQLRGLYPTVKMRWMATQKIYFDDKYYFDNYGKPLKGEDLYKARTSRYFAWIPLTIMWITTPFDAAIDTLCIPWDWE
jgi:uncharacterized protein YceK